MEYEIIITAARSPKLQPVTKGGRDRGCSQAMRISRTCWPSRTISMCLYGELCRKCLFVTSCCLYDAPTKRREKNNFIKTKRNCRNSKLAFFSYVALHKIYEDKNLTFSTPAILHAIFHLAILLYLQRSIVFMKHFWTVQEMFSRKLLKISNNFCYSLQFHLTCPFNLWHS